MVVAGSTQDAASMRGPGCWPRATSHLLGDLAQIILPKALPERPSEFQSPTQRTGTDTEYCKC